MVMHCEQSSPELYHDIRCFLYYVMLFRFFGGRYANVEGDGCTKLDESVGSNKGIFMVMVVLGSFMRFVDLQ
jgi:hypothetical protein